MSAARVAAPPTAALALAATIAGMLFTPVFGATALLLPVTVPAAAVLVTALACASGRLPAWRPVLTAVAGLLAVVETSLWSTTVAGVPTAATLRALATGATDSWQLVLQSTWPAQPEPELLLFVPLLVVLAGVLGIELLHRERSPLLAFAPSFALAVLSQFYAAAAPVAATVAAIGYAAAVGLLLTTRTGRSVDNQPVTDPQRVVPALAHGALSLGVGALAVLLTGAVQPAAPPRYGLQHRVATLPVAQVTNPLNEIAYRLAHPGTPVFRVSRAVDVDRWPLVVFDEFDGVNWTSGDRYRRLGTGLPPNPALTVDVDLRTVDIATTETVGPWLPSQTWPATVANVDPLIEPAHGTLLHGSGGPTRYTLSWWQPEIDENALTNAAIDPEAPGGRGGVGAPPAGTAEFAETAVRGLRPSFQAALALERSLSEGFQLATGESLPTGHSWPQLADFLLRDRRGTSEQFAAAYVVLARMRGIPARLVVGFRTPTVRDPDGGYTVRNGDVLAWPEVAVRDVGWVPLDPSGVASASGAVAGGGPAGAAARARSQLPAPEDLRDPPVAPPSGTGVRAGTGAGLGLRSAAVFAAVPVVLLLGWLIGLPAVKAVRSRGRRGRTGLAAVVAAVEEARDRLCDHGVEVSTGMTPRDMAVAAAITGEATVDPLRRLAATVDQAMWSGTASAQHSGREAWGAVRDVRRALARRGWRSRLRAALEPRSLLPPHRRSG
ncbi:MAG TPA: transglutaminaseTgpA domain-containing protein [Micromonosporaceae bacterium]|nr:transglutaminaseTgpA domain-containing protein [Micromonosporaceae bacterium]